MKQCLISQIARHFYAHYILTGAHGDGWYPDSFKFNTEDGRAENFTYDECVKIMNCEGWSILDQLMTSEVTA